MTARGLLWLVCTSLTTVLLLGVLILGGSLVHTASEQSVFLGDELSGYVFPEVPNKSCTSIVVGKEASADGSTMVTYTADCGECDFRLVYVPEKDHAPGEMRPVFPFGPYGLSYPRIVSEERAPGYAPVNGQAPTTPLGYIPEAEHTFAYLDGVVGVMNEHQLAIGETTGAAKTYIGPGEGALFDYASLSKIAMERCKTAREAIYLMGSLAEQYGYYGWGETLTVIDPNEAWVFEIVPTPGGSSAVWAAQRVPDEEVAVVANMLAIREVDPTSPDFMISDNLFEIAETQGWWRSGTPLDFLRVYTPGEYNHPYYSLRRRWRAYDLIAPSRDFAPWVQDAYTNDYPFSVKPDRKVTVEDLFRIQRDYYEGTDFDLTQGVAAGPFGTPNRYEGGQGEEVRNGAWERAISLFRCSYSYVLQARSWLPDPIGGLVWWGPDAPHSTVYVPFYAGITRVPEAYSEGNLRQFSRDSAWWAFDFVSNWADLKFSYMIQDIREQQTLLEGQAFGEQSVVEQTAASMYETDPDSARDYLTDYCASNGGNVVREWWSFADYLIVKYHDGYVNTPVLGEGVGYPAWWLDAVEYDEGPTQYREP